MKFPDGVGFYPDIQDGVRGYNTDPKRGADTFTPFKKTVNLGTGTRFDVSLYSNHKKYSTALTILESKIAKGNILLQIFYNDATISDLRWKFRRLNHISGTVSYDAGKGIVTVSYDYERYQGDLKLMACNQAVLSK